MARYRLAAPHFIRNTWMAVGAIIEFDGRPSRSMVPLDEAAQRAVEEANAKRPKPGPARRNSPPLPPRPPEPQVKPSED